MMRRRRGAGNGLPATSVGATGPPVPDEGAGHSSRKPLGELLVGAQLITSEQLADALLRQTVAGKRLGAVLVDAGALTELELAEALAFQLELDLVDLSRQRPAAEAVALLSETIARDNMAIPLALEGERVKIAVADPTPELQELLRSATRHDVQIAVAPRGDVQRAIDTSYRAQGQIEELVSTFELDESSRRTAEPAGVQTMDDDAPVVRVVDLVLTQALRDRASDVHIEPQGDRLRVRVRIDGALHDTLELPMRMASALTSRIKILAGMNIVERRRPQDGQFTTTIDGREIDIRVSTVASIWGECCVMRLLDKSRNLLRMADLGMPSDTNAALERTIRSPFGMVLCAGPTGSGKTTTLYAALAELDEPQRNIMTIEDPVEYVFPTINQIQTHEQAGITFATGLRSILRQDPDVILVGEIRDVDTARVAVQSALTGHFVLSSIHATDSAAALHRFLDMGIESFLIASSVVAVVAQRLVRRMCQSCKVPYELTDEEAAFYTQAGGSEKEKFWHGFGCNFCAGTGYRDRIGVFEVMRITPELKRLIVGWATQEELLRMAVSQGMRTLQLEGIRLVEQDITTVAEVLRSIYVL